MADTVIDKPVPTDVDIEKDDLRIMEEAGKKKEIPAKKPVEEEEPPAEEEEDLIQEEESEEEGEEEKEEEIKIEDEPVNYRGIDWKKLKEKYPEFAKTDQFRALRDSFYRESKFTELFPTVEDAAEAAENNETFIKLNDEVLNKGSMAGLLTAVKEASPDALKKVSATFLDDLQKIEPQLYVQAITPAIKRLAKQIYIDGRKMLARDSDSNEGKALVATAKNVAQWAFDDPDLVDKQDDAPRRDSEIEKREKELNEREQRIAQQRFESALRTAKTNLDRNLDKQILEGLHIENEFVRDSLLEKIKNEVEQQISSDTGHLRRMQSLWKRAEQEGYDNKSLSRIISAYLERARPIIPIVRNRLRGIAIRGKSVDKGEDEVKLPRGRSGRAPSGDGKINMKLVDPKKIDYSQTSDDDIMSGKVKLRS